MNSFVKEIAQICDIELAALIGSYSYSVYGNSTVAVEGVKKILSYRQDSIVVGVVGGNLIISGDNLTIRHYSNRYLVIVGTIVGMEVRP